MPRVLNIVVPTLLLTAIHAFYWRHDTVVVTADVSPSGELVPKWIVFNIPDQYQKLRSNLGINATEIRNGYALPSN
ncbi:hypothetical protein AAVH_35744 [Aphelenchoides avenae]|nr:hypothetical protein AAVH_35744 [Aphelenchus avenae]